MWTQGKRTVRVPLLANCFFVPSLPQGDLPIHMYFIKRGVCAVSKDNLKHHVLRWPSSTSGDSGSLYEVKEWDTAVSVDLGKLHAGTYFGESSIMNGTVGAGCLAPHLHGFQPV